jgi:hypothetical protein
MRAVGLLPPWLPLPDRGGKRAGAGQCFQALLAEISKLGLDLAAHLTEGVFGDADPTGFRYAFKPGCM